jgi:hypothetical protein
VVGEVEDGESAPIVRPFKPLYDLLLAKVYAGNKAKLDEAFEAEKASGEGNDLNALRRLAFRVRTKPVSDDQTVIGYNLQTYRRQPTAGQEERGFSVYLVNRDGVSTIHFDKRTDVPSPKESGVSMTEFGNPQSWHHIRQVQDLLSDSTFLSVNPGKTKFGPAKPEEIGASLWSIAKPLSQDNITDGLGIWRGYISGLAPVKRYGTDENMPILGSGGEAHLNVIASENPPPTTGRAERGSGMFLELTEEPQLRALMGELYDPNELMSENGLRVQRGNLVGTPVLIFGSGLTSKNPQLAPQYRERMKASKIKFNNGLGRIVPFGEES